MPDAAATPAARLSESARQRPWLWLLLGTLVVLQFGYPVTLEGPGWTVAYLVAYLGVIAFAVKRAHVGSRRNWPLLIATPLLIVSGTVYAFRQDDHVTTACMLTAVALLQAALVVSLATSLLNPPQGARTTDLLLVAVCTYLLLGGVFGMASGLIELAAPGSFTDAAGSGEPLVWQGLTYGSYVTLATLGFGDIVPVTAWARSLWSFEAVLGTLFVAVVIARLVGVAGFLPRDDAGSASGR